MAVAPLNLSFPLSFERYPRIPSYLLILIPETLYAPIISKYIFKDKVVVSGNVIAWSEFIKNKKRKKKRKEKLKAGPSLFAME